MFVNKINKNASSSVIRIVSEYLNCYFLESLVKNLAANHLNALTILNITQIKRNSNNKESNNDIFNNSRQLYVSAGCLCLFNGELSKIMEKK